MTKTTRFLVNTFLVLLIVSAVAGLGVFAFNAWIVLSMAGVL